MDRKHIINIASSSVVSINILAGLILDDLIFGFAAIAFAIIFHAQATAE